MQLPAFAQLEQRLNGAVQQHLSNAVVSLGALQLPCTHDVQLPGDSPFADVATRPVHRIGVLLPFDGSADGLQEGASITLYAALWPAGQSMRITSAVDVDATGWANFEAATTS